VFNPRGDPGITLLIAQGEAPEITITSTLRAPEVSTWGIAQVIIPMAFSTNK